MTRERDPFLENAKVILVWLVTLGHALEPWLGQDRLSKAAYVFIYAFHVPVLVLIAGHLSDREPEPGKLMRRLLLPYVLLQAVYVLLDYVAFERPHFGFHPLTPYWVLWFVVSLFFWRASLPYFLELRAAPVVGLALALLAGYWTEADYALSLQRTFTFLPLFLLGALLPRKIGDSYRFLEIGDRLRFLLGGVVLLLGAVAAWRVAPGFDFRWLYGSYGYGQLGHAEWSAAGWRGAQLGVAVVLGAGFLLVVPRRRTFFTAFGAQSLHVFLLHGLFVKGAVAAGWYPARPDFSARLVVLGLSLGLTAALSSRVVGIVTRPLVEPTWLWGALRR